MNFSFEQLDESDKKYQIDKLVPMKPDTIDFWSKQFAVYQGLSRFWEPRILMAKKCQDAMRRKIFSDAALAEYKDLGKIPVEPQELKPYINSLQGMITDRVKGGSITMEDSTPPPNAASPEVVNVVIKHLENELKLSGKKKKALREGLITGLVQWLWFNMERGLEDGPGNLSATLLPWDATLSAPLFLEDDGSDIDEVIRIGMRTKSQMYRQFPDRKSAYEEHLNLMGDSQNVNEFFKIDSRYTANDRNRILLDRLLNARFDAINGFVFVVERTFVISRPKTIWVNEATHDVQVIPEDWTTAQADEWQQTNPDYALKMEPLYKTLWVSTISNDGFVWENGEHWFQEEGRMPGVAFIADVVDKIPTGAAEDALPHIIQIAVSETEGLHQVRTGTGTVTHVEEGALRHPKFLKQELTRDNGVVIYKKGHTPRESMVTEHRKPNDTYLQMSERSREKLHQVIGMNPSMLGTASDRQSNRSRQSDIKQGSLAQSPYIENYNNFTLNVTQLLCYLLPYGVTEAQVVQIEDEFGKKTDPVEVNKKEFDTASGQAHIVANDLTSVKYRVIAIPGDDSYTNREREMTEFVELLEATGNSLMKLPPALIGILLGKLPNRFAQEAAQGLQKFGEQQGQAQQAAAQQEAAVKQQQEASQQALEADKIRKPRWNFRLTPKDFEEAPKGFQVMMQMLGALNQPEPSPGQGQQQAPPPGAAQPEPAMAMA